ncbi:carbamoyltransferase C-terminal domain-containing protein, partial [Candidatus Auribacterota bacterium]
MDLAASVQVVLEEVVLKLAHHAKQITGEKYLTLAGGVALNCVANGKILREKIFDKIWIQPSAGDAGGALGAAYLVYHQYFNAERKMEGTGRDKQHGSYLGPGYKSSEIMAFLNRNSYPYERIQDEDLRSKKLAALISQGQVVGYFAGRMEFGPRSLGSRSILGDPRNEENQSKINLKIKYRESFRPFAPSTLAGCESDYFDLAEESPYMLIVAPVKEERCFRIPQEKQEGEDMIDIINQKRSDIPAVTHVDYSARVQTVHEADKPDYYRLIKAFKDLTGCGVLINTSFNVRGEPIVCSPKDAYTCFMRTEMDILVLEDCVLFKKNQPQYEDAGDWR